MRALRVKHQLKLPSDSEAGLQEAAVVVLIDTPAAEDWPPFPWAGVLADRLASRKSPSDTTPLVTDLPTAAGTRIALARIKADIAPFDLLSLAAKLAALLLEANPREIALWLPMLPAGLDIRVTEALFSALLAATHRLPSFKSTLATPRRLTTLHVYGLSTKPDLTRAGAEAEGNNLARTLTALPPNTLTPLAYREKLAELTEKYGWNMHVLDIKALRRQKAGAFLAVAQGSSVEDAAIVQLCYHPRGPRGRKSGPTPARLALVGKGICYDTGGNNLKPAKSMFGMHEDMEGSAVALGTLIALTRLKVDFPVHCWLALAQNHIGPNAYKQNDVVTASNGVTIEIVHTDAEGRMVLADTLALASAEHPRLLIDYATLTGSCIQALGTRYSGAFTNRPALIPDIISAGRTSGERVWPFPMDADYDKELDSDIADIKQCTLGSEADHILAARFLSRFIKDDTPWLHIDLASGNHKGGLAHIPSDITGFGVRFTVALLVDGGVMGKV